MAARRITKELDQLMKDPEQKYSLQPVATTSAESSNTFEWNCSWIPSCYTRCEHTQEDSQFMHTLHLTFPPNYPFKPMQIKFIQFPQHTNSKIDENGNLTVDLLTKWTPAFTTEKVLQRIDEILSNHSFIASYNDGKPSSNHNMFRRHPLDHFIDRYPNGYSSDTGICLDELDNESAYTHRYDMRYDDSKLHHYIVFIPDTKAISVIKSEIAKYVSVAAVGDIICGFVKPYFNALLQLDYLSHSDAYGCSNSYSVNAKLYYKAHCVEYGVSKYIEVWDKDDEAEYRRTHKISLQDQLTAIRKAEQWPMNIYNALMEMLPTFLGKVETWPYGAVDRLGSL